MYHTARNKYREYCETVYYSGGVSIPITDWEIQS